jgi:hypothetical protein
LTELLNKLGAKIESGAKPSAQALCFVTPIGDDATTLIDSFNWPTFIATLVRVI